MEAKGKLFTGDGWVAVPSASGTFPQDRLAEEDFKRWAAGEMQRLQIRANRAEESEEELVKLLAKLASIWTPDMPEELLRDVAGEVAEGFYAWERAHPEWKHGRPRG